MNNSRKTSDPNFDEDAILRSILEGTSTEIGERFFAALVKKLSEALGTFGAWVTEYDCTTNRMRALAFWLDGNWVEEYEYDLVGTPCEPVIQESRLIHFADNIIDLFPKDPSLRDMNAVSYMGLPLRDVDGRTLGHLAVLDRQPMPGAARGTAVFKIFGARAEAEMRRLRAESRVRDREEKLGRLVDSAMDAIVELNEEQTVTLANPAAERMFGLQAEKMTGQSFNKFLAAACRDRMGNHCAELEAGSSDRPFMWIPGGLQLIREGGGTIATEATLSRSKTGAGIHFTLILRNMNERLEAERKIRSLTSETKYLRQEIRAAHHYDSMIGDSGALRKVRREIEEVAKTDSSVLILGETGTGKELVAREIHAGSRRRDQSFIKVNCAAIPAALIESEFFGHEKGAFTGATQKREGRFALAHGGTIFLDEIGELHVDLQVKLLRILQEGEFEPVGSSRTRTVDVRVLAATNRDLEEEVQNGKFREDLFYRLNVFPLHVPPLRERGEDIGLLASTFLEKFATRMGRTVEPLTSECLRRLKSYDWPGNVRELQNVIERGLITAREGRLNLDRAFPITAQLSLPTRAARPDPDKAILTVRELQQIERDNLVRALEATGWRVSGNGGASQLLGIHPSTLSSRMKALKIKRPR
jgi:PAS domain S-box-containing protein